MVIEVTPSELALMRQMDEDQREYDELWDEVQKIEQEKEELKNGTNGTSSKTG